VKSVVEVLPLAPRRWAFIGAVDAAAALLIGNWLVAVILLGCASGELR
jgi:hypothetical protein